ncbi:MAG: methyltransferase domain-containing protein [Proteobacteria bacterium]|nr:methyltransferase domain-containing protein [Pseudomonadota bacterium]
MPNPTAVPDGPPERRHSLPAGVAASVPRAEPATPPPWDDLADEEAAAEQERLVDVESAAPALPAATADDPVGAGPAASVADRGALESLAAGEQWPTSEGGGDEALEDVDEPLDVAVDTPDLSAPPAEGAVVEPATRAPPPTPAPSLHRSPSSTGSASAAGPRPPPTPASGARPIPLAGFRMSGVASEPLRGSQQWWELFFDRESSYLMPGASAKRIESECDFVESCMGLAEGATLLDVGCGRGDHIVELSARGYTAVGIDISATMLRFALDTAQERNVLAQLVHADVREIGFEQRFDGLLCWGTSFGLYDDQGNRAVLGSMYRALRPGGRLLMQVVNRDYLLARQPDLCWFEAGDSVCMEESDLKYLTSRLHVKRTRMRRDGTQREHEYTLRVFSAHELGQLVHKAGFRVVELSGHAATRGVFLGSASSSIIVLAERRARSNNARSPQSSRDGAAALVAMRTPAGDGEAVAGVPEVASQPDTAAETPEAEDTMVLSEADIESDESVGEPDASVKDTVELDREPTSDSLAGGTEEEDPEAERPSVIEDNEDVPWRASDADDEGEDEPRH